MAAGADGGEVVLYVEDDIDVRETVALLLEGLGYRLLTARTATEAFGILNQRADVDLLFSDVVMPGGMTGIELAAKARELRPELKIVLTSGYSHAALSAERAPAVHWLAKPFQLQGLAEIIRAALDGEEPVA